MSNIRTLIAGSSYIPDQGRVELTKLWARVIRYLNPETDVLLVDSGSAFDPGVFLKTDKSFSILGYADNIGALSQGGRDGSGRAFIEALSYAVRNEYDYCMFIESDMICALPAAPIIEKMHRTGVKVAAPFATPYQFPEFGLSFWSVEYLRESKFAERYDWENAPKWPIPEWRIQHLTEDDFFVLPIHGFRNSQNTMNVANFTAMFPYAPCSWLTHCADHTLYYRMLDMNRVYLKESA